MIEKFTLAFRDVTLDKILQEIKGVTLENGVYTLIAFFLLIIIFCIPLTKYRFWNLLINTGIVIVIISLGKKYIPISDSLLILPFALAFLFALVIVFTGWSKKADKLGKNTGENGVVPFLLKTDKRDLVFDNPFRNFMAIGGANAGKTKSVGKPLLKNYVQNGFAGFVYDLKDFDYTKSAFNLVNKFNYPHKFCYMNFVDLSRTHRTNILNPKLIDENIMIQLMSDILLSYLGDGKKDEWYINALGIFKGVGMRFYYDYPQYCNLPTIVNFCVHNDAKTITAFLKARPESTALASGFIASADSVKTQASILSSLTGYIGDLAFNKKICYVLSGDDFDFNMIDPLDPKLICISNSFGLQDIIGPVVGLMVKILSRHFSPANKINSVFFLDEATTFKIDGFEGLPSVLREYKASFVLLTQSTAKIEKVYGKLDKAALQANFGNLFYGAISETNDIKDFSLLFTRIKEKRISKSRGASGRNNNRSTSISHQDKDRYEPSFFKQLKAGEFVGVTSDANQSEFHTRFKMYEYSEEEKDIELPVIHPVSTEDLNRHYTSLISLVKSLK